MNVGTKLLFIEGTFKAFFTTIMYVFNVYGQSYDTAASTIGTAVIYVRTSALFPDLLITVAWRPTTAMLAWEFTWVEAILSYLSSTEVILSQITLILSHKGKFGTILRSPLEDDPGSGEIEPAFSQ